MRNDVFIARIARGTMAAGVAGAWMLPQKQAQLPDFPLPAREAVHVNVMPLPQENLEAADNTALTLTISKNLTEWDKKLEKEFRGLALAEAKGTLSVSQGQRLEELNHLRNQLLHGQTAEEISLQLKRDRLIDRMESLLREYVEFQETTGQKRGTA